MNLTRSLRAIPALLLLLILGSCQRENSIEQGVTSVYDFQDVFGDCLGDSVLGNYIAGQVLNGDASYVELKLNVHVPGRYSINSDIQNGFSFAGSGTFADTGLQTVRVPARGTPQQAGISTLRISHNSTFCDINVNVTATAQGGGSCNAQVAGNYYKDTVLGSNNTVSLSHNYATAGTFLVSTDTINGYYFSKNVTVTAPGATSIVLNGSGTPLATGSNNFTVRFGDSTTCGFPITVTAPAPGSTGCGTANGTFTAGTALTAANTVTVNTHTYASTGTFTVQSNTVNGISFGPATTTVTTAGSTPSITLNGTGTPTAAGTFTYSLSFGDGSQCSFTVTVAPGSSSAITYFPLTANSWWSYADPAQPTDTIRVENTGTGSFGGNTYRMFVTTDIGGVTDTNYFRKDASGVFVQNLDLNDVLAIGGSSAITFPAGTRGDIPLVKDGMTQGETLTSAAFTGTASGVPTSMRVRITCTNNNASLTVNGNSFSNVYLITTTYEFSTSGGPFTTNPLLPTPQTWFAPNVGLIQIQAVSSGQPDSEIRHWQVF
jgi:hypothetical protein